MQTITAPLTYQGQFKLQQPIQGQFSLTSTPSVPRTQLMTEPTSFVPSIPIIPPRFGGGLLPPFVLPPLPSLRKPKTTKQVGSRQQLRYTPSLIAEVMNIRATKVSKDVLTGVHIRPIVSKTKRVKKKVRR